VVAALLIFSGRANTPETCDSFRQPALPGDALFDNTETNNYIDFDYCWIVQVL